ncbi:F-box protein SKIP28-like [Primulina tabacum]|uniref:F-box protein SKIP28-like n=1 Tax=Primulina tabacum TaxID=48773 RepID=UPI003F5A4DAC
MEENNGQSNCLEQRSSPHEAIFFVLTYLPLFELLSMSQVCRSLGDAINNDILPWMQLVVDRPLNFRISDDILMRIASKSKGQLQVLALLNCVKITDDGLLRVVAQNSFISKLYVPSCTNLSTEGIITAVRFLAQTNPNLNCLRINGIYGIKKQELKTLQELINPNLKSRPNQSKIFYHKKLPTLLHEGTYHSIDVEVCPICDEVRMVFDCPRLVCGKKCRGCDLCIPRCKECGICFNGIDELEEAACVDSLCLDCWLKLPKCSFCNKPYCNEHAGSQLTLVGSEGFVCGSCHSNFIS